MMRASMTVEPERRATITNLNGWISVAKNAVWVIGLVAVGAMKLNSIDNVNASQDEKISKIQEENKVLKASIDNIRDKQVDQLVMLTRLVTLAEQKSQNNTIATGVRNERSN